MILEEGLVAAVNMTDDLAARKTISIDALRDRRLITLPKGTGVRAAFDAACFNTGFKPRIVLEASALPMIAHLAGLGLGVAIMPSSAAKAHHPALHAIPIGRPQIRSRLELVWSATAPSSPAARILIEHTRAFVRNLAANRALAI